MPEDIPEVQAEEVTHWLWDCPKCGHPNETEYVISGCLHRDCEECGQKAKVCFD